MNHGESGKTINVSRHEIKYMINLSDASCLANVLGKALVPDENNGFYGYQIRSLYFDTLVDTDFYQKVDGVESRKKIRLRRYGSDSDNIKLEIKRKQGMDQVKETVIISKEDAKGLINCDYDVLCKYKNSTAQSIYNLMRVNRYRPVVFINYNRKAFLHSMNNIRLTLDSEVASNETNFDFFNNDPVLIPVFDFYNCILEVKYDGFLPKWITEIISNYNLDNQSFSKYCLSRRLFETYMG